MNTVAYKLDSKLPHLLRAQRFIDELEVRRESADGEYPVPNSIDTVEFESVDFSYHTGEQVLDNISFTVDSGEFVAFVGPSGVGKSTVVSLLARLYEPDSGRILANGTPIDQFAVGEWRSNVAIVRQQPYIFNDTLRYNLTIGEGGVTQAELDRACEIAQVSEFLTDLPEGYETQLGDDGVRLSGGQRQRVAIARAILRDADVIVFDEATSDLDNTLEQQVHDGIMDMSRDFILIVIAHRLSTVRDADRIYSVDSGRIAESGSHDDLIEQDGMYADLYTA
jgi:subfamily B ATP-binding cassette protein MsbA